MKEKQRMKKEGITIEDADTDPDGAGQEGDGGDDDDGLFGPEDTSMNIG